MTTEFPIEWEGFAAQERKQLKTKWSRIQFAPEFTANFQGVISKGAPGEAAFFHFEARQHVKLYREHHSGPLPSFEGLDGLLALAAQRAEEYYNVLTVHKVLAGN